MSLIKADTVLHGGRVWLGIDDGFAEAIALWNGKVLATGPEKEIAELIGSGTKKIDLRGRTALPGLNDAHQHMLSVGLGLTEVNLKDAAIKSIDDILSRIKAQADKAKPGEWIFGRGYDHFQLDVKRHPLREELDLVAPYNPVYVKRTCGHMGVANSAALDLAGVDENTPQPAGGHIESQNGRLTGLMQETAQSLIQDSLPDYTPDELRAGVREGQRHNLGQGFTSVTDPGVGLRQGYDEWVAYQDTRRDGELDIRMHLMPLAEARGWSERAIEMGLMTGDGDEWIRVGPMKLFADGSAGGRTAAVTSPYEGGDADDLGILICSDDEIFERCEEYHRRGYQVATHAIGDRAIDQVLEAYERAMGDEIDTTRRHRIEHCGFLRPDQIDRMVRLGVIPAPQAIFLYEFGDLYIDVLGEERSAASYPFRTWKDRGLHPSASSDAPVSATSPYANIYSMVTRRTNRGTVLGADQALSVAEALHAYTYDSAYGSFEEDAKGRLVAGQLADIAVPDRDLFTVDPDELLEAENDLTIVGGEVRHDRLSELS
ncbi:MAG: amidohydrolase [Rhodospirillaceae bacterium]|nr:amidohydrolase [Rhodospirillaceae bacterium]